MKYQLLSPIFISFICILLIPSCITISSYQTGRTVGKGIWEIEMAGNGFIVEDEPISFIPFTPRQEEKVLLLPYGELNNYYGVTENLDLGIRLSSSLYGALTFKQQLIGGKDSPGAVAIGGSFGAFLQDGIRGWDVRLPVFFSFHPYKKLDIYMNPNYIYQFGGALEATQHLYGSNIGLVIRNKIVHVGFDAGLYNFFEGDAAVEQIGTLGMSIKVVIY